MLRDYSLVLSWAAIDHHRILCVDFVKFNKVSHFHRQTNHPNEFGPMNDWRRKCDLPGGSRVAEKDRRNVKPFEVGTVGIIFRVGGEYKLHIERQRKTVAIPELLSELLEQVAFEARDSEYIDPKSGVSARLTISAYENLASADFASSAGCAI